MQISTLPVAALLALVAYSRCAGAASSDGESEPVPDPCTITNSAGAFFDLSALSILPPDEDDKTTNRWKKKDSWHARGYDTGTNYTLNVCAPVTETDALDDVVGIDEKLWKNVSAYYESGGKTYSLGQQSSTLISRGKRIVLRYTDGSPCGTSKKREAKKHDDEDDEDDGKEVRRKSTHISFLCEKDPLVTQPSVSFVDKSPDDCAYFFEIRSYEACGGTEPAKDGVGPGAVFAIIGVIAILVYFLGGVFYQRNVAHARGMRQLPNYTMWAGIGNLIKDFFIIATSSCARFLPSRRGYSALSTSANGRGGRRSRNEDENRLIDQLDEEWDD
ncbi:mannose-6-phosphate receptor binding domain-containing protein [Xylogone sp. PMI_703]|nr:mannose-6-phosphate receptor binding domain-containing protein [Xylogone sp. PMI_703]